MSSPVLQVLAGPNGAGMSTFMHTVLQPVTHLPFINSDEIAAQRWPGQEVEHAYDASAAATAARDDALSRQRSFITETVFSHPSKIELVKQGISAGYLVTLHAISLTAPPSTTTAARPRRSYPLPITKTAVSWAIRPGLRGHLPHSPDAHSLVDQDLPRAAKGTQSERTAAGFDELDRGEPAVAC